MAACDADDAAHIGIQTDEVSDGLGLPVQQVCGLITYNAVINACAFCQLSKIPHCLPRLTAKKYAGALPEGAEGE